MQMYRGNRNNAGCCLVCIKCCCCCSDCFTNICEKLNANFLATLVICVSGIVIFLSYAFCETETALSIFPYFAACIINALLTCCFKRGHCLKETQQQRYLEERHEDPSAEQRFQIQELEQQARHCSNGEERQQPIALAPPPAPPTEGHSIEVQVEVYTIQTSSSSNTAEIASTSTGEPLQKDSALVSNDGSLRKDSAYMSSDKPLKQVTASTSSDGPVGQVAASTSSDEPLQQTAPSDSGSNLLQTSNELSSKSTTTPLESDSNLRKTSTESSSKSTTTTTLE